MVGVNKFIILLLVIKLKNFQLLIHMLTLLKL